MPTFSVNEASSSLSARGFPLTATVGKVHFHQLFFSGFTSNNL